MEKLIGLEDLPEEFRTGLNDEFRLDLFRKAENEVVNFKNLARKLNISEAHLSELKRGLIFIRIKTLRILLQFAKITLDEAEKSTEQIISGKVPINIKLPLMTTKELASLVGHVFGDGHIKVGGQQFHFINKNIDLINEIKKNIKLIFGIDVNEHFRKEKEIFELFIPSTVAKLLMSVGAPEGKKSTQIFHVPNWIKEVIKK